MTAIGFYILLNSMSAKNKEEEMGKWDFRIVIWITGSVVLYAILLPIAGFLLSVLVLVFVSASASHEYGWKGTTLNAAILVAFTYLAFVQGLKLQFQLLPAFLN